MIAALTVLVVGLTPIILGLGQLYLARRLREQDSLRNAARVDATERDTASVEALNQIHVLVNTRMTDALDRVAALEHKLGLAAGETIPSAAIVTAAPDLDGTAAHQSPDAGFERPAPRPPEDRP